MNEPKVSIIVISHRLELLKLALESIERQTYNNIEVLIHHTLAAPHTQMIEHTKINRLVASSIGKYISILCEDDEYDPRYVETCVKALEGEEVDMVYTDRLSIGHMTKYIPSREFTLESFQSSISNPIPGTIFFTRSAWNMVGGYTRKEYADGHFAYMLLKYGINAYHLQEPLFLYRIHMDNYSSKADTGRMIIDYYKEYPELALGLNFDEVGMNKDKEGLVINILTALYGDKSKWPNLARSSLERRNRME